MIWSIAFQTDLFIVLRFQLDDFIISGHRSTAAQDKQMK